MKAPFPDTGVLWALGLSVLLHLMAGAVLLGLGQVRAGGEPDAGSGPLVLTVSLTLWEDSGGGATAEVTDQPSEAILLSEPEKALKPEKAKTVEKPRAPSSKGGGQKPAPDRPGPVGLAGKTGPAESAGPGGAGASRSGGGGGNAAGYVKGNYEYIKKRIRQHLVYHPQAKRLGIQGTVTVSFIIGADGRARNTAVAKSSGSNMLDDSAIRAVHKASPFPPPPGEARIVVPISFSLK
ncbi:MAG: energy transducer TonB [Deltaproteobacteria bacterium]|nr:energy transducer TonB [Deltaproteobacteria bacterium]